MSLLNASVLFIFASLILEEHTRHVNIWASGEGRYAEKERGAWGY